MIATRAKMDFGESYMPIKTLANLYASKKCFSAALQVLDEMAIMPLSAEQDSSYQFVLAYSRYEDDLKLQSVENWKYLLNSQRFFRQSAACYFMGSVYLEQGQREEAKKLFARVAERGSESKFANYCKWKLRELE